ncbi:RNA binding S1 domain protein [Thioploca ingrica]|uniref:RNA binding S1 domain protein n=1 Tax=Thioploca ingrica TaxID=40754 RepID=A0A090AP65_9GAMM|nr:RNA binding S1 domain protein [Thioploca ingrica]
MKTIPQRIAAELSVQEHQVQSAILLLDEGATVPFIARYRKEATNGLNDVQLRTLEERLHYLRELDERREFILTSIREQEKLTPELEAAIQEAETKTRLEDLYLPYKPKRRSRAKVAKEAGLEPLALDLWQNPTLVPEEAATAYVNAEKGIEDTKQALEGARHILMEKFAEEAELLGELREYLWENAVLVSKVLEDKEEKGAKFADYFDYHEALQAIPSHRALALFRGRKMDILQLTLVTEPAAATETDPLTPGYCEGKIANHFNISNQNRPADTWLLETVHAAWNFKVRPHLDAELLTRLRERSENEAIKVFASNLQDLLLAAPAGPRVTMGLDPGLRTGVKVAIIDNTGKLLDTTTLYPHAPKKQWQQSIDKLAELANQYQIELISIGNGTGSRETDKLVMDLIKQHPQLGLYKLVVSEAGASVYSASKIAAQEFPDLDVSIRGAVSIARRLQDPLAELVKIEPKSIGVGQYQHDVNKAHLARSLDAVVEDCVNAVGVDINTASIPLLSHVSGLNMGLARSLVEFRDKNGTFLNRETLKQVPRFGEKSFEQAAGFLRIMNGDNPLDASAVHPEAYPVIERIIAKTNRSIKSLIGESEFLRTLQPEDYIDEKFGIPTVTDIIHELEKPGRDPRPVFKTAHFQEGIEELEDLEADMVLEGIVTNVTNFGAFVDIGVHQDGLVHISALSNGYVKDPREVVKAGEVVKVKVIEVDLKRRRVALTMCLEEKKREPRKRDQPEVFNKPRRDSRDKRPPAVSNSKRPSRTERNLQSKPEFVGIMAEAFANARKR